MRYSLWLHRQQAILWIKSIFEDPVFLLGQQDVHACPPQSAFGSKGKRERTLLQPKFCSSIRSLGFLLCLRLPGSYHKNSLMLYILGFIIFIFPFVLCVQFSNCSPCGSVRFPTPCFIFLPLYNFALPCVDQSHKIPNKYIKFSGCNVTKCVARLFLFQGTALLLL